MAQTLLEKRSETLATLPEWQKLLEHFELSEDSFAYIPLLVQDDSWAEVCEKNLTAYLSAKKKKLRKLAFTKPEDFKNLAGKLLDLKFTKTIGAIWITAPIVFRKAQIEIWQEAWREATARLNQYRNPLREKFPVTFIFVGGFWTQEITRTMAPDLWSIRLTVVRIEPPDEAITQDRQIETIETKQQFEEGENFDADYALKEAKRLRKKKGAEITAANLFYRAAVGFRTYGRLQEAQKAVKEAIEIYRQHKLEKELADSLNIEGITLDNLGKLTDAIKRYEEAEKIYEHLELANDLAGAYVNKGVALVNLGRLDEAVGEYDKAIAIYEELVKEQGRVELANDLARTYMNKGVALANLSRLNEAIAEFDKAIAILEELVKEKGRVELADDLAMAYLNKGVALENAHDLDYALVCFDEGIAWWEQCLARGEHHVLPDYVKGLANRVSVLIKLEDWSRTANDVVNAFNHLPLLESPEVPDYFKQRIGEAIGYIIKYLKEVSPGKREEIYKHAGELGEVIRRLVDEN